MVAGHPIKDDILIILGIRSMEASPFKRVTEVKYAIIKLLKDELGLEVVSTGSKTALSRSISFESSWDLDPNWQESSGRNKSLTELESSTRRPAVLQRFKVTRESLEHWLQRKSRRSW